MVRYRRDLTPGGTYFFTVALRDRRATLLTDHHGLLRDAFRAVRRIRPFSIRAMVLLPDHLHAVWTLPESDADYPGRWRAIKSRFVRTLAAHGSRIARNRRGEAYVWQRRYWEHRIRDERDLQNHVDYIHFNPVKHGYAARAADWPHSTVHAYIRRGWLSPDWGNATNPDAGALHLSPSSRSPDEAKRNPGMAQHAIHRQQSRAQQHMPEPTWPE